MSKGGLLGFVILVVAAGLLSGAVASQGLLPGDLTLARWLQGLSFPGLGLLMHAVSLPGYRLEAVLIAGAVAAVLAWRRQGWEAIFLLLSLVPAGLNEGLKEVIDQPAPGLLPGVGGGGLGEPSFPSTHVVYYTVFYGFLLHLAGWRLPQGVQRLLLQVCLLLLIILVAPSRIYLGAHWPSDVLGGYLFGGLYLLLFLAGYRWFKRLPLTSQGAFSALPSLGGKGDEPGSGSGLAPRPFLSIVIPAYNEERSIQASLEELTTFLAAQPYSAEIVVADDGSSDNTASLVAEFASVHPGVSLLRLPHQGKGGAVRVGMLAARGDVRFLCDADLSMPPEQIGRFLPLLGEYDIALGSREAPGARRFHEPWHRHLMGRIFNLLLRLLLVPGLQDTQCGFKAFRGEVAQALFPLQRTKGFAFDGEVLFLARRAGYRLVEVPIDWYYRKESRVRPLRHALAMVKEVLLVRWHAWRGHYEIPGGGGWSSGLPTGRIGG